MATKVKNLVVDTTAFIRNIPLQVTDNFNNIEFEM